MFSLFVLPALLQIALPLALLAWQAAGRDTNLISWLLKHGVVWWDPFSSDPLPIRLDGHNLVRNDRMRKFSPPCEKNPDLTSR